ncbi:hypothetical protein TIFTF001_027920 [Ficus carica]|uniref:Uncharacterized protein n=1 Tax=Ficus carica TaxID=3494 RepID=A0AA88DP37_FICCA|nr:hypothetical protein TIFTF001_027920 [Ficus carica]
MISSGSDQPCASQWMEASQSRSREKAASRSRPGEEVGRQNLGCERRGCRDLN